MNISKAFGLQLKQARKHANLSQPQLAKQCGWESQSRVSNYERGERTPSLDDIEKLANALNISICELISNNSYYYNNQVKENEGTYKTEVINTEVKEVVEYALNNQLKNHYIKLPVTQQISLVFELYTSTYKDKALLDAAKNMQATTLLKMVNN